MRLEAWTFGVLMVASALAPSGCRLFDSPEGPFASDPVLRSANPSPDSVTVEVLLVQVPDHRLVYLDEVWLHADEQVLDADVRRELARNGFRAGVIGPSPPPGLAELLNINSNSGDIAADELWQTISLDRESPINRHQLQLRPRHRAEVQTSPVHERIPLLIASDGGLTCTDFEQAQGQYALQWTPLPQGRIQVELTPEIHHGAPRNQFSVVEGNTIQRQVAKTQDVFEDLRIHAPLSAGQMLLVSAEPAGRGSLGHFFHTAPTTGGEQHKLILIRLAQVPDSL